MIDFKSPSEQQQEIMREVANAISGVLTVLTKYEANQGLALVATKLQEAMMWFNASVLNDTIKLICPEAPKDTVQ